MTLGLAAQVTPRAHPASTAQQDPGRPAHNRLCCPRVAVTSIACNGRLPRPGAPGQVGGAGAKGRGQEQEGGAEGMASTTGRVHCSWHPGLSRVSVHMDAVLTHAFDGKCPPGPLERPWRKGHAGRQARVGAAP